MDMATDLRARMAAKQLTVDEVARMVGRNRPTVSRYRNGHQAIPLEVARVLLANGLLSPESILGPGAAA